MAGLQVYLTQWSWKIYICKQDGGVGWEPNTSSKTKSIKKQQWSKKQYYEVIRSLIPGVEELEFKPGCPIY